MAKIYSLAVFIRGRPELFHFIVDKSDHDRLMKRLDNAQSPVDPGFFCCDTADGRSVIINLHAVQAVRFLWDAFSVSGTSEECDEPIRIYLRGREEPVGADTDSAESIYDFFRNLEYGPGMFPFPGFEDSDGEYVYVNASEVDLVVAPKALMDEGLRIALADLEETTPPPKPKPGRKN